MANPRLEALFQKFLGEEMTEPELRELQELIMSPGNTDDLDQLLQKAYSNFALAETGGYDSDEIFAEIMRRAKAETSIKTTPEPEFNTTPIINTEQPTIVRKIRPFRWVAAASVVVLVSLGSYFIFKKQPKIDHQIAIAKNDITAPNTNRARITLSNGQNILIDSAANGTLATEGNTKLEKLSDGKIVYNGNKNTPLSSERRGAGGEVAYNTLFNPRGSRPISILLADGTTVWLNAESSLKYPVAFAGNERKVEITGEAFIEVKHDAARPFQVKTKNAVIRDIGTQFNINAYSDNDAETTTLLEGAVEVAMATAGTTAASSRRLSPGEQAMVQAGEVRLAPNPDIDQVMAWKNGKFSFDNTNLETILKEFSRWYDVKVVYENKVPDRKFFGIMNRSSSLATVLSELQANNVKFELEGKTLTVK